MADPAQATLTQLRNIETKSGQSLPALCAVVAASGLIKHGEVRAMLMERYGLGYGDANALAHHAAAVARQAPAAGASPTSAGDDALAAIYAGAKAALRPLHEQVIARFEALGPFEIAPKKAYVSLRRKKQFAMLGPATKEQIELGLNAKDLPPSARLKALPPGGMCQYSVRLSQPGEIDAELIAWIKTAFDAAA